MTTTPSEMVNNTPSPQSVVGVPSEATVWLSVYSESTEMLVTIFKSGVKMSQSDYYIRFADGGDETVEMVDLFSESTIPESERPVYSDDDLGQLAFDEIWDIITEFSDSEYDSIASYIDENGLDAFFEF